jgi:hypothetical protein
VAFLQTKVCNELIFGEAQQVVVVIAALLIKPLRV